MSTAGTSWLRLSPRCVQRTCLACEERETLGAPQSPHGVTAPASYCRVQVGLGDIFPVTQETRLAAIFGIPFGLIILGDPRFFFSIRTCVRASVTVCLHALGLAAQSAWVRHNELSDQPLFACGAAWQVWACLLSSRMRFRRLQLWTQTCERYVIADQLLILGF